MYEPVWFVQLYYDYIHNLLVIGNDNGEIFCWKANPGMIEGFELVYVFNIISKRVVRKVRLTNDNTHLIAVSDDGLIWIHKLTSKEKNILGLN